MPSLADQTSDKMDNVPRFKEWYADIMGKRRQALLDGEGIDLGKRHPKLLY